MYISETFSIGDLVRKETEVQLGSTLQILLSVPGGTLGKTFSSSFHHATAVLPQLPSVDIAGAFTVVIADSNRVELSTPTGSLLPGRYVYDVTATSGLIVSTSATREFVVLQSISSAGNGGGGGAILPPDATASALVSQHNLDPLAHGGQLGGGEGAATYSTNFTQSDLSTAGILVRQHGLTRRPSTVSVFDNAGELVTQTSTLTSTTAVAVDLVDFIPMDGTWQLIAST